MSKYTLIYHSYFGYGSYIVHFKRIRIKPSSLSRHLKGDVHFVVDGWPIIQHPDGTDATGTPRVEDRSKDVGLPWQRS